MFFAFGLGRLTSGVLLSQQQLAQHLQVAAQDAQAATPRSLEIELNADATGYTTVETPAAEDADFCEHWLPLARTSTRRKRRAYTAAQKGPLTGLTIDAINGSAMTTDLPFLDLPW